MFTRFWKIGNTTLVDLQFVGDGMLAFFNAPHAVSDHAAQAREAAQAAQHSLDHFNQATDDAPSFQTRIGLNRVQFETRRFQFRSSLSGRPWKIGTTGFKLDAV